MNEVGIQFNVLKGLLITGEMKCSIVVDGKGHDVVIKLFGYNANRCFMCGHEESSISENISHHHILNRAWKPKKNLRIPMCRNCHDFVHFELPNNLVPFKINSIKKLKYALQYNRTTIDNLIKKMLLRRNFQNFNAGDLLDYQIYNGEEY